MYIEENYVIICCQIKRAFFRLKMNKYLINSAYIANIACDNLHGIKC